MIERVLYGGRMRAVLRDWNRFWTRKPGIWYERRFKELPEEDRAHLLVTLESVKTDLHIIGAYFMDKPEGHS